MQLSVSYAEVYRPTQLAATRDLKTSVEKDSVTWRLQTT